MEFLEFKTEGTAAEAYLLSSVEIVNNVQQLGTGALLIVNNDILGLLWCIDSIYLFDSHSRTIKIKMTICWELVEQFFENLIHCTHW